MKKKTILVIDDSAVMRMLNCAVLVEAGFDVLIAENGKSALEQAQDKAISLVLTDWHMSPMDGGELTRALRQMPNCLAVPIVVLSTINDKDCKDRARESGANGWLCKPIDPVALLSVINKLLHRAQAA